MADLPSDRLEPSPPFTFCAVDLFGPWYEGGSICNENPFITPSTNVLGLNAICQTKDQSVAVIMVHKTLFYLSKFNKLQTFQKAHKYTLHIFSSEL